MEKKANVFRDIEFVKAIRYLGMELSMDVNEIVSKA